MEERTGWREQNKSQTGGEEKKNGRLYGAAETSKERAEWCKLQQKNLNKLGLLKRKKWPQCHRGSSCQVRRSRLCQKGKGNRAVCPEYQIMRVERLKVGESRTLASERRIRARAWRGEGGIHGKRGQIPRRKGRASKKSLPKRSRRKHKRVSGCKSSPGRSVESWLHS